MKWLVFIAVFTFSTLWVSAMLPTYDVRSWTKCSKGNDAKIKSIVKSLKVSGCNNLDVCPLSRGSVARITVEFEPSVKVLKPKAGMYWTTRTRDFPFMAMKSDGCLYMNCPVNANRPTIFNATLNLGRSLPAGTYPLKLKVFEKRNVIFCNQFTIKLS